MKKDLLDVLQGLRDALDDLVLSASPDEVGALAEGRDRVSGMIQEIIELDYKGTAEGMEQATRDLGGLREELTAAKAKADEVSTAVDVAGKVATVVAGVVGAVG
jgi:hypothetical protein